MQEIWKDIPGYEGYYQASDAGRIRSLDRVVRSKLDSTQVKKGRIRKPTAGKSGYLTLDLVSGDRVTKTKYVHRLVAQTFIPNPEEKEETNHKDGNKKNNQVDNLEWVTPKENSQHASKFGLKPRGSKNPIAKLKECDIPIILSMLKAGCRRLQIQVRFGIGPSTVSGIKHGKGWRHVSGIVQKIPPPKV